MELKFAYNLADNPSVSCFNRTFMELKFAYNLADNPSVSCFNRTFMELKSILIYKNRIVNVF